MQKIIGSDDDNSIELLVNRGTSSDVLEEDLVSAGWRVTRKFSAFEMPIVVFQGREVMGFKAIALEFCSSRSHQLTAPI